MFPERPSVLWVSRRYGGLFNLWRERLGGMEGGEALRCIKKLKNPLIGELVVFSLCIPAFSTGVVYKSWS